MHSLQRSTAFPLVLACLTFALSSLPLSSHAGATDNTLPPPLLAGMKAAKLPPAALALFVQPVNAATPSIAVRADAPQNPASTMKLITTFAGLELLGPPYRWQTGLYGQGRQEGAVWRGDIYLKGSGDPRFDQEQVWGLLRQLRLRGIRDISGQLKLDRTLFPSQGEDDGGFDGASDRPYNVSPDPLTVNYKTVRVYFFPDADGGVRLTADPAQPELELVNKVALGNGSDCTGWKDRLHSNAKTKNGVTQLTFSGTFPAGCTNAAWYLAMNSHPRYTTLLIANLWKELGGNWPALAQQAAKIGAEASSEATPYGAPMLASSDSATLTDIIRDINKNSNNLMARLLFLTLGTALPSNSPNAAITERAAQNVQGWLQQKGLNFPELVLENGSGLSRNERISTAHLGQLLLAGWQSPYHGEFLASLPISGIDGTVKKRFTGSIVTGQAHLKTGTLNDVRALAGYVRAKSGQWVVVAAIINHPAAERGGDVLTATAEWVFENY